MNKQSKVNDNIKTTPTKWGDGSTVYKLNVKKEKPSIFIGSSSESYILAKKIKRLFSKAFNVDTWKMSVFNRTNKEGRELSIAEQLKNFTDIYDFAIFLFVPDEEVIAHTRIVLETGEIAKAMATKHNVIFEFGLFLGRLGAKNSVILYNEGKDMENFIDLFFTDLKDEIGKRETDIASQFNIKIVKFSGDYSAYLKDGNQKHILKSANKELKEKVKIIENLFANTRQEISFGFLPSTSLAYGYYNNFLDRLLKTFKDLYLAESYIDEFTRPDDITELVLSKKKVVFYIIIPDDIIQTRYESFENFVKAGGKLKGVNIKSKLGRPCTVYIRADHDPTSDTLEIYDFPTVLGSSIDAIEFTSQENDIRELLSEKERRNFEKVMRALLSEKGCLVEKGEQLFEIDFMLYGNFVTSINQELK